MLLPNGAMVAVVDGETFNLFPNTGDEAHPKLTAVPHGAIEDHARSGSGHHSSSVNADQHQVDEDGFSGGAVAFLNKQVLEGKIASLVVIAAPRTLGEMRKHYHARLSAALLGEIAKDLTAHSLQDVENAVAAA
jgi:protein required for attachment to host cells